MTAFPKVDETPQEDLRHAAQMLTDYGTGVSPSDIEQAKSYIWLAIKKLEGK